MANELSLHLRLTADGDNLQGEVRVSREELERLNREARETETAGKSAGKGYNAATSAARDYSRSAKSVSRANNQARESTGRFTRSAMSLRDALGPLVGAVGAGMMARMAQQSIAATAALSEQADVVGLDAERFQELTKSFSDLGGVAETVSAGALRRFNRRLGLAQDGAGAGAKAFEEMGTTLTSGTGEALDQTIQYLAGVENEARRAALASQVFGEDAGPKMAAVLAQGTEAIDEQIERLHEQGRVLDNEAVAGAREANDAINELTDSISTRFNGAIAANADEIRSLVNLLGTLAENVDVVGAAIGGVLVARIGRAVAAMTALRSVAAGLSIALGTLGGPAGIALAAGGALAAYAVRADSAATETQDLSKRVAQLTGNVKELQRAEIKKTIEDIKDEQERLNEELDKNYARLQAARAPVGAEEAQNLRAENEELIAALGELDQELFSLRERLKELKGEQRDTADTTDELTDAQKEFRKELSAVLDVADPVGQAAKEYGAQVRTLKKAHDRGIVSTAKYEQGVQRLAAAYQSAVQSQDPFRDRIQEILDLADPAAAAAREHATRILELKRAYDEGIISAERYGEVSAKLAEQYQATQEETDATKEKTRELAEEAGPLAQAWERAAQRIDDSFVDLWASAFDNTEDFLEQTKRAITRWLAEIAHALTTRKLMVRVGVATGVFGGGSGVAQAGQAASMLPGGGSLGDLLGLGGQAITPGNLAQSFATSGVGQSLGLSSTSVYAGHPALSGAAGLTTGGQMLTAAGAAAPWAIPAGFLGQEIFGGYGGAGASAGTMAGAAIGSVVPGIGTVLGGILGGVGGGFLGGLFGGGRTNHEWFRLLTGEGPLSTVFGPSEADERDMTKDPLASATGGLGRVAVSGHDDLNKKATKRAQEIVDGVAQVDTAVANALGTYAEDAREALAGSIAHTPKWEEGKSGQAERNITSVFQERYAAAVGAVDEAVGEAIRDFDADTSDELAGFTVGAAQLAAVYRERLDAADEQIGAAVADALSGAAPDFAALNDALGDLGGIGDRSGLRILQGWAEEAQGRLDSEAFGERAGQMGARLATIEQYSGTSATDQFAEARVEAGRTLTDVYRNQAEGVRELIDSYDGSYEATQELAGGVTALRQRELALLQQIDAVQQQVTASLSDSAESIRKDLMGDDERYEYLRNQAKALKNELKTMTDPAKIGETAEEIRSLTMEAYSGLSDTQKEEMGEGLADYLDGINELANERLDIAGEQLTEGSEDISQTIDGKLTAVADRYDKAAAKLEEAAGKADAAMSELSSFPAQLSGVLSDIDIKVSLRTESANDGEVID